MLLTACARQVAVFVVVTVTYFGAHQKQPVPMCHASAAGHTLRRASETLDSRFRGNLEIGQL